MEGSSHVAMGSWGRGYGWNVALCPTRGIISNHISKCRKSGLKQEAKPSVLRRGVQKCDQTDTLSSALCSFSKKWNFYGGIRNGKSNYVGSHFQTSNKRLETRCLSSVWCLIWLLNRKSFYFRGEIKGAKLSQGSFFTFPNPSSFSLNSQTLFSSFPPPWKPVSERKRGRRVKLAVLCCLGLWHITDLLSRSLPQRLGDHMDLLRNMLGLMVRTASTFKLGLFCSSHLGKHWRNSPRF